MYHINICIAFSYTNIARYLAKPTNLGNHKEPLVYPNPTPYCGVQPPHISRPGLIIKNTPGTFSSFPDFTVLSTDHCNPPPSIFEYPYSIPSTMPYSLKGRNVLVTGGSAYVVAPPLPLLEHQRRFYFQCGGVMTDAATAGWASSSRSPSRRKVATWRSTTSIGLSRRSRCSGGVKTRG